MVTVMLGVIAIVIIAAAILIGIIAGKTTRPASSKAAQETQETATEESAETAGGRADRGGSAGRRMRIRRSTL